MTLASLLVKLRVTISSGCIQPLWRVYASLADRTRDCERGGVLAGGGESRWGTNSYLASAGTRVQKHSGRVRRNAPLLL